MKIGAVMFFTTDSMQPGALARALEERGFESLWVPEHTHIPSTRKTPYPAGGALIRPYYDIMDPFLALNTAATVTTKLKIGTGIALVTQRDPIVTAKMVSIDRPAVQRPLPVRRRQRLEPGRDREPRHRLHEPPQAGARADRGDEDDLDRGRARVSRRVRELRQDEAVAQAHAEAASADHRRRRASPMPRGARSATATAGFPRADRLEKDGVGVASTSSARWRPKPGAIPPACRSASSACPTRSTGLRFCQEIGIDRVVFTLPAEKEDKLLPIIDRWAELKHQLGG